MLRPATALTMLAVVLCAIGCGGSRRGSGPLTGFGGNGGSHAGESGGAMAGDGSRAGAGGTAGTGGAGLDGGLGDAAAPSDADVDGSHGSCAACGSHQHCQAQACVCDSSYTGSDCGSCASGYVHDHTGMVCVLASCPAASCTSGQERCQNGQLQICDVAGNGCLQWSSGRNCSSGGCWCPTDVTNVSAQQWGGTGSEGAFGVAVGPMGEAIATGTVIGPDPQGVFVGGHHASASVAMDWSTSWPVHTWSDEAKQVLCDSSGAVFVGGQVHAALPGEIEVGFGDSALGKWGSDHQSVWNAQWGSTGDDQVLGFAAGSSGALYAVGSTTDTVSGAGSNPNPGNEDVLLTKLSASGSVQWNVQWGGSGRDFGASIAVVAGAKDALFVVGTLDGTAFCSKRNDKGVEVWTTTWDSAGQDGTVGVVVLSSGEIMVVGYLGLASSPLGLAAGPFLSKLGVDGHVIWSHHLALSAADGARGMAQGPSGDLYVTGSVNGELVAGKNHGSDDVYVYRITSDGNVVWTKQLGTDQSDVPYALAVASDETVYVASDTGGAYPGFVNGGSMDAVLLRITQ